jgi:uncharacterized protein YdaU (DUF1376 family)
MSEIPASKLGGKGFRPWHHRWHHDMLTETLGLTMAEYGQYTVLLDLIFSNSGTVHDDPEYISRPLRTNARGWRRIRDKLIKLGKIYAVDGGICSVRADREIKDSKQKSDAASTAGYISAAKKAFTQRKTQSLPQTLPYVSRNIPKSANDFNGRRQRPFNQPEPEPEPDIRKKEEAAPPPSPSFPNDAVVVAAKGSGEQSEPPITVSPYLAQQIQSRRAH